MSFIRQWHTEDVPDLVEVLNNKNVLDNLRDGLPFPYKLKDAEKYIKLMIASDPTRTLSFAIALNKKAIGSISVLRNDNIHYRTAEIGYYIGEKYWGLGIGTKAVKEMCDYIFKYTNIIRIYAEPFAHNVASCRVLEKSGFTYEGTLRSNAFKNGRVLDMKMYSLVRDVEGLI